MQQSQRSWAQLQRFVVCLQSPVLHQLIFMEKHYVAAVFMLSYSVSAFVSLHSGGNGAREGEYQTDI